MIDARPSGSSGSSAQPRRRGRAWFLRRELALTVLVVAALAVLLTRRDTRLAVVGVLLAITLAGVLQLWQRQGESLRRERVLSQQMRMLAQTMDRQRKSIEVGGQQVRGAQRQIVQLLTDQAAKTDKREAKQRFDRRRDFAQVEALLNLHAQFPPSARMPGLRGWAISPDLLLAVVDLVRQRRPATIVELGAGSSTVWLAHVLRTLDLPTKVITLEHDEHWAVRVRELLAAQGLTDRSVVRLAPLVPLDLAGEEWPWYDPQGWGDLPEIDLLLVDGPPGSVVDRARFPAVPLLLDRLGPQAVIVMDDAARADERKVAQEWAELLDGFTRLDLPVEKKAILFYRGDAPAL
jgi:predicted O-methyltransferase YrrM